MLKKSSSVLALVLAAALVTGACMDNSPFIPKIENTNFDPSLEVDLAASVRTESGLYYRDVIIGGGEEIPDTGYVRATTRFELYLRNGELLSEGNLPPFTVGAMAVIDGYDEGVRGMRVGGKRQLIIPPHLGYGSEGFGPVPKNAILIYLVDLTKVDEL